MQDRHDTQQSTTKQRRSSSLWSRSRERSQHTLPRAPDFAKHFYHDKQSLTAIPDRPQFRMGVLSDFVSAQGFNDIAESHHWARQEDEKREVVTPDHYVGQRGGINTLIPALPVKYKGVCALLCPGDLVVPTGGPGNRQRARRKGFRKSERLTGDRVRSSNHREVDKNEGAVWDQRGTNLLQAPSP